MSKKKLGRSLSDLGLTELLSDFNKPVPTVNSTTKTLFSIKNKESISTENFPITNLLAISQLQPASFQPRYQFDEQSLIELAASIKSQGIIQPIIVRQRISLSEKTDLQFEIIAGERRWRAAKLAGLSQVPVLIKNINDQDAMALALIENLQRRDLNPLEEAEALQRLLKEFKLTHQQIADSIGKSRTTITNTLRLLNLHPFVKQQLLSQQLEMGHARALLALPLSQQMQSAKKVMVEQLSVRETEQWVRQQLETKKVNSAHSKTTEKLSATPLIKTLQDKLGKELNTKVLINHKVNGKGRLIIHYQNWENLNIILEDLKHFVR